MRKVKFSGIKNAPTFYLSSKLNSEYQKTCIVMPPGVWLYFMSKKNRQFCYLVTYDGFSRGRVLSHLILNISSLDSQILETKKLEYSRHIYLSNAISYSYIVEVFHL